MPRLPVQINALVAGQVPRELSLGEHPHSPGMPRLEDATWAMADASAGESAPPEDDLLPLDDPMNPHAVLSGLRLPEELNAVRVALENLSAADLAVGEAWFFEGVARLTPAALLSLTSWRGRAVQPAVVFE